MTLARQGELIGVIGALSFWAGAADVLTRHARGEALDDEEERRLHLAAYAGQRVGEPLLCPSSEADHDARIFAAVEAWDFMRLSAVGHRWTLGEGWVAATAHPVAPALADVFGRGALPCLEEGDACATLIAASMVQLWDRAAGVDIWVRYEDMLHFLCDPAVPREIVVAAAYAAMGAACFTAMAQAVIARREVRPKIAAKLAEQWVIGERHLLRLLAAMPGVSVDEAVVLPSRRFDLEPMFAQAAAKAAGEPSGLLAS